MEDKLKGGLDIRSVYCGPDESSYSTRSEVVQETFFLVLYMCSSTRLQCMDLEQVHTSGFGSMDLTLKIHPKYPAFHHRCLGGHEIECGHLCTGTHRQKVDSIPT